MKSITNAIGLILLAATACKEPLRITANPDDHTNAGGTAGSAKMTNQLPPKANNVPIRTDTLKLPNDTIRVRQ